MAGILQGILAAIGAAAGSVGFNLYSWGANSVGQLGQNDTVARSSPVQVGALSNWSVVSAGTYSSFAVASDGTLWAWGSGNYGQLGLGDVLDRSSPVQVGALTNWATVTDGWPGSTLAIKTNGTLWAWGNNSYLGGGQLGLNDTVNRSSPVQVGVLTNWSKVRACGTTTIATKTDGTLWAWGSNYAGSCGLNDTVSRSSPVQVGALTDWNGFLTQSGGYPGTIWHIVKTNGTLWACGRGQFGGIGDGQTINRSSPVQIGGLTTWDKVVTGDRAAGAVKTDGTLWLWGLGTSGQLGQNDAISRSSPVQVGALTNWNNVGTTGYRAFAAITTTNQLYAWGANSIAGNLGLGDKINRSSPTQVGSSTGWKDISGGIYHVISSKS